MLFRSVVPQNDDNFIHLSALRDLEFHGCGNGLVGSILSWLQTSSHSLAFMCTNWHNDTPVTTRIFPEDIFNIRSHLYPLRELTTLSICYEERIADAFNDMSMVRLGFEPMRNGDVMPDFRALLSLRTLRELWLSGHDKGVLSTEDWRKMFGEMDALVKVVISLPHSYRGRWLYALSGDHPEGRPFPAPKLRDLHIFQPWPETGTALLSLLRDRNERGHRVHELCVLCKNHCFDDRIRQAFEDWREAGELSKFVDVAKFEKVAEYPRIHPPGASRPIDMMYF